MANPLGLPPPENVPGFQGTLPYFFVGDDAFALSHNMMKPYPLSHLTKKQCVYNYRISRDRRIVENAFGLLVNKFRVFKTEIALGPECGQQEI